ncbi:MAG: roadblock/LC7 domain-containing protein [Candidatus Syntropharchaeia archaeon]
MKIDGVLACGAFIHGIPIETSASNEVDEEELCAYAQDLINYSRKVADGLGSRSEFVMLEMDDRKLIVLPIESGGVVVLTDGDVNLGMVRMAIRNAISIFKSHLMEG